MLRFNCEWEDEPRIREPLLRRTWARLEVRASCPAGEYTLTECLGLSSKSVRTGVYGSVFPLAKWLARNWWHILSESYARETFDGGRKAAAAGVDPDWLARHCTLVPRAGFALPDLTLFRDGDALAVVARPDPQNTPMPYPVRFLPHVTARLDAAAAANGIRDFLRAVDERVRESPSASAEPEFAEYLEDLAFIRESGHVDSYLASAAAAMGLDPYDPESLTPDIETTILGPLRDFREPLRRDILDSTRPDSLAADAAWTASALNRERLPDHVPETPSAPFDSAGPPHEQGFRLATEYRRRYDVPVRIRNLGEDLFRRCGMPVDFREPNPTVATPSQGIQGFVARDGERVCIVGPGPVPRSDSRRFLEARAFYHALGFVPRLMTQSFAPDQRASRAFAAEILAPIEELRRVAPPVVDQDILFALGEYFHVSTRVIEHQLTNHLISIISD